MFSSKRSVAIYSLGLLLTLFACFGEPRAEVPGAKEPQAAEAGPRIAALSDTHDFGQVSEGSVVSHTFVILNEGDAPLHIIRAKGG